MDTPTQNIILAGIALAISVGGTIIGIINHKRLVSSCCGRKADISLDIQDTRVGAKSPTRASNTNEQKISVV